MLKTTLSQFPEKMSNLQIIIGEICDNSIVTKECNISARVDETTHEGNVLRKVRRGTLWSALFQGNTVDKDGAGAIIDGYWWDFQHPFVEIYVQEATINIFLWPQLDPSKPEPCHTWH